jgi:predicted nucleic acid-binding protein
MRHALVDTNVVLDVLLDRQPHVEWSSAVWAAIETGLSKGFLAVHAITTIHYLVRKELGSVGARRIVSSILRVFDVAAVDSTVIQEALRLSLADFEDSVTAAAAHSAGCEFIVTRDPRGFRGSPIRPVTPEAFIPILNAR